MKKDDECNVKIAMVLEHHKKVDRFQNTDNIELDLIFGLQHKDTIVNGLLLSCTYTQLERELLFRPIYSSTWQMFQTIHCRVAWFTNFYPLHAQIQTTVPRSGQCSYSFRLPIVTEYYPNDIHVCLILWLPV